MVYVLSKNGKPLMPTNRYGHIRWLIKNNKAIPICNNPFTIRLKYDTSDVVQPLTMGIDVGRENIGLGVSDNNGNCLFLANVETKNKQVTKNMSDRKVHRQERRRTKRTACNRSYILSQSNVLQSSATKERSISNRSNAIRDSNRT